MSKTKTKRARRELKREESRKAAAQHRKASKPSSSTPTSKPANAKTKRNAPTTTSKAKPQTAAKPPVQASQQHAVPFGSYDNILLVGEGDFSFTRSLVLDHGCANVTATSYDSLSDVQDKYPTFADIYSELTALTPPVPFFHSIDATKVSTYKSLRCKNDEGEESEWDTIAFMFPHTGGLSTDVNRQVRANQALLVDFFKSCLEVGEKKKARMRALHAQAQAKDSNTDKKEKDGSKKDSKISNKQQKDFLKMGGKVIVTLFEGEPYTLWNARDLARHAGLKVVESWKFDWAQYPGYKHVRTLGAIEGGGGWKGEERDARMFVFEKIPLEPDSEEEREMEKLKKRKQQHQTSGKKRPRDESDSEEDDD